MAKIELISASKSYGSVKVIENIDLTIESQEFTVFVGPSGCGKSTLLRMICGLESFTSGSLRINGEDITKVDPSKRGLAMVFQSYALYPHMTVGANIGFSLKVARRPKAEVAERVGRVAEILQLTPYLGRYPRELSGGQRQRVAIGRAIVREPMAFLFDEPLSNLDAALRGDMRLQIAQLHRSLNSTTIYVTHDQTEAMTLADRIVVLNEGKIEQIGTPYELYETPANEFVARFIGNPRINIFPCSADSRTISPLMPGAAHLHHSFERPFKKIGVRPEHISVHEMQSDEKPEPSFHAIGQLHDVEYFGSDTVNFFDCGFENMISVRLAGRTMLKLGERYGLNFDIQHISAFDDDGLGMPRRDTVA